MRVSGVDGRAATESGLQTHPLIFCELGQRFSKKVANVPVLKPQIRKRIQPIERLMSGVERARQVCSREQAVSDANR
jgi:hypothetical protein